MKTLDELVVVLAAMVWEAQSCRFHPLARCDDAEM
jgi:hypothetical protein